MVVIVQVANDTQEVGGTKTGSFPAVIGRCVRFNDGLAFRCVQEQRSSPGR